MPDPGTLTGIDREIARAHDHLSHLHAIKQNIEADPSTYLPLLEHAERVFGDEGAWVWLCNPLHRLNDLTPLAAWIVDQERVTQLLGAIEYGVYL